MRCRVEVLLECDNCREKMRADVDIVECVECGGKHPAFGTLSGGWLRRWIESHLKPHVYILSCQHVDAG